MDLKKSASCIVLFSMYYLDTINLKNAYYHVQKPPTKPMIQRQYKSVNDLPTLSTPPLFKPTFSPSKLFPVSPKNLTVPLSYGEFLKENPNSTKKQRQQAILRFYQHVYPKSSS